jgi:hypothetical protein
MGGAASGKRMCWSQRAFLRYLHHRRVTPLALAEWRTLYRAMEARKPADLSVRRAGPEGPRWLRSGHRDGTAGSRHPDAAGQARFKGWRGRDLTLDDIDWRSGEMLIRAKGRQRARMPMPPDVCAPVVAYLRNSRPTSSCRRLMRTLAPRVGFASGCAITMIAKTALEPAGVRGYAHRGAHIFRHRHSLATEFLRSGATLSEIGTTREP